MATIQEGAVVIFSKNVEGCLAVQLNDDDDSLDKSPPPPLDESPSKKRQGESCSNNTNSATLFYNPAQVFNRDVSLLVIKVFGERRIRQCFDNFEKSASKRYIPDEVKGLKICEPLAASGLRSLRYAKELPRSIFRNALASDLDSRAVDGAKRNREKNNVDPLQVHMMMAEATELMNCAKFLVPEENRDWHVVDIDPYGSVTPFVDSAVRSVKNGGLLNVTSTDMPVLGGNNPEVAFYKYGGSTVKARFLHEMSLRLVIHQVRMAAAKYRRFATPLLSLSCDFYVRIFFQICDKPARCKQICSTTAVVLQCVNCDNFTVLPFGRSSSISQPRSQSSKKSRKRDRKTLEATEASDHEENNMTEPLTAATDPQGRNIVFSFLLEDENDKNRFSLGRLPEDVAQKCTECDSALVIAGPFYAGPLHDPSFVDLLLKECDTIRPPPKKSANTMVNTLLLPSPDSQPSPSEGKEFLLNDNTNQLIHNGVISAHNNNALQENVPPADDVDGWIQLAKDRFEHEMAIFQFKHLSPASINKLGGILCAIREELPDIPLYYRLSSLCNDAHIMMIKLDLFKSALLNAGYRVGIFHRDPLSIKTDAPARVVFDVVRAWITKKNSEDSKDSQPVKNSRIPPRYLRPLRALSQIDFTYNPLASPPKHVVWKARWVNNPSKFWGPARRVKGMPIVSPQPVQP